MSNLGDMDPPQIGDVLKDVSQIEKLRPPSQLQVSPLSQAITQSFQHSSSVQSNSNPKSSEAPITTTIQIDLDTNFVTSTPTTSVCPSQYPSSFTNSQAPRTRMQRPHNPAPLSVYNQPHIHKLIQANQVSHPTSSDSLSMYSNKDFDDSYPITEHQHIVKRMKIQQWGENEENDEENDTQQRLLHVYLSSMDNFSPCTINNDLIKDATGSININNDIFTLPIIQLTPCIPKSQETFQCVHSSTFGNSNMNTNQPLTQQLHTENLHNLFSLANTTTDFNLAPFNSTVINTQIWGDTDMDHQLSQQTTSFDVINTHFDGHLSLLQPCNIIFPLSNPSNIAIIPPNQLAFFNAHPRKPQQRTRSSSHIFHNSPTPSSAALLPKFTTRIISYDDSHHDAQKITSNITSNHANQYPLGTYLPQPVHDDQIFFNTLSKSLSIDSSNYQSEKFLQSSPPFSPSESIHTRKHARHQCYSELIHQQSHHNSSHDSQVITPQYTSMMNDSGRYGINNESASDQDQLTIDDNLSDAMSPPPPYLINVVPIQQLHQTPQDTLVTLDAPNISTSTEPQHSAAETTFTPTPPSHILLPTAQSQLTPMSILTNDSSIRDFSTIQQPHFTYKPSISHIHRTHITPNNNIDWATSSQHPLSTTKSINKQLHRQDQSSVPAMTTPYSIYHQTKSPQQTQQARQINHSCIAPQEAQHFAQTADHLQFLSSYKRSLAKKNTLSLHPGGTNNIIDIPDSFTPRTVLNTSNLTQESNNQEPQQHTHHTNSLNAIFPDFSQGPRPVITFEDHQSQNAKESEATMNSLEHHSNSIPPLSQSIPSQIPTTTTNMTANDCSITADCDFVKNDQLRPHTTSNFLQNYQSTSIRLNNMLSTSSQVHFNHQDIADGSTQHHSLQNQSQNEKHLVSIRVNPTTSDTINHIPAPNETTGLSSNEKHHSAQCRGLDTENPLILTNINHYQNPSSTHSSSHASQFHNLHSNDQSCRLNNPSMHIHPAFQFLPPAQLSILALNNAENTNSIINSVLTKTTKTSSISSSQNTLHRTINSSKHVDNVKVINDVPGSNSITTHIVSSTDSKLITPNVFSPFSAQSHCAANLVNVTMLNNNTGGSSIHFSNPQPSNQHLYDPLVSISTSHYSLSRKNILSFNGLHQQHQFTKFKLQKEMQSSMHVSTPNSTTTSHSPNTQSEELDVAETSMSTNSTTTTTQAINTVNTTIASIHNNNNINLLVSQPIDKPQYHNLPSAEQQSNRIPNLRLQIIPTPPPRTVSAQTNNNAYANPTTNRALPFTATDQLGRSPHNRSLQLAMGHSRPSSAVETNNSSSFAQKQRILLLSAQNHSNKQSNLYTFQQSPQIPPSSDTIDSCTSSITTSKTTPMLPFAAISDIVFDQDGDLILVPRSSDPLHANNSLDAPFTLNFPNDDYSHSSFKSTTASQQSKNQLLFLSPSPAPTLPSKLIFSTSPHNEDCVPSIDLTQGANGHLPTLFIPPRNRQHYDSSTLLLKHHQTGQYDTNDVNALPLLGLQTPTTSHITSGFANIDIQSQAATPHYHFSRINGPLGFNLSNNISSENDILVLSRSPNVDLCHPPSAVIAQQFKCTSDVDDTIPSMNDTPNYNNDNINNASSRSDTHREHLSNLAQNQTAAIPFTQVDNIIKQLTLFKPAIISTTTPVSTTGHLPTNFSSQPPRQSNQPSSLHHDAQIAPSAAILENVPHTLTTSSHPTTVFEFAGNGLSIDPLLTPYINSIESPYILIHQQRFTPHQSTYVSSAQTSNQHTPQTQNPLSYPTSSRNPTPLLKSNSVICHSQPPYPQLPQTGRLVLSPDLLTTNSPYPAAYLSYVSHTNNSNIVQKDGCDGNAMLSLSGTNTNTHSTCQFQQAQISTTTSNYNAVVINQSAEFQYDANLNSSDNSLQSGHILPTLTSQNKFIIPIHDCVSLSSDSSHNPHFRYGEFNNNTTFDTSSASLAKTSGPLVPPSNLHRPSITVDVSNLLDAERVQLLTKHFQSRRFTFDLKQPFSTTPLTTSHSISAKGQLLSPLTPGSLTSQPFLELPGTTTVCSKPDYSSTPNQNELSNLNLSSSNHPKTGLLRMGSDDSQVATRQVSLTTTSSPSLATIPLVASRPLNPVISVPCTPISASNLPFDNSLSQPLYPLPFPQSTLDPLSRDNLNSHSFAEPIIPHQLHRQLHFQQQKPQHHFNPLSHIADGLIAHPMELPNTHSAPVGPASLHNQIPKELNLEETPISSPPFFCPPQTDPTRPLDTNYVDEMQHQLFEIDTFVAAIISSLNSLDSTSPSPLTLTMQSNPMLFPPSQNNTPLYILHDDGTAELNMNPQQFAFCIESYLSHISDPQKKDWFTAGMINKINATDADIELFALATPISPRSSTSSSHNRMSDTSICSSVSFSFSNPPWKKGTRGKRDKFAQSGQDSFDLGQNGTMTFSAIGQLISIKYNGLEIKPRLNKSTANLNLIERESKVHKENSIQFHNTIKIDGGVSQPAITLDEINYNVISPSDVLIYDITEAVEKHPSPYMNTSIDLLTPSLNLNTIPLAQNNRSLNHALGNQPKSTFCQQHQTHTNPATSSTGFVSHTNNVENNHIQNLSIDVITEPLFPNIIQHSHFQTPLPLGSSLTTQQSPFLQPGQFSPPLYHHPSSALRHSLLYPRLSQSIPPNLPLIRPVNRNPVFNPHNSLQHNKTLTVIPKSHIIPFLQYVYLNILTALYSLHFNINTVLNHQVHYSNILRYDDTTAHQPHHHHPDGTINSPFSQYDTPNQPRDKLFFPADVSLTTSQEVFYNYIKILCPEVYTAHSASSNPLHSNEQIDSTQSHQFQQMGKLSFVIPPLLPIQKLLLPSTDPHSLNFYPQIENSFLTLLGQLGRGVSALVNRGILFHSKQLVAIKSLLTTTTESQMQVRSEFSALLHNRIDQLQNIGEQLEKQHQSQTKNLASGLDSDSIISPNFGLVETRELSQLLLFHNTVNMVGAFSDSGWATLILEHMNRGDLYSFTKAYHQWHQKNQQLCQTEHIQSQNLQNHQPMNTNGKFQNRANGSFVSSFSRTDINDTSNPFNHSSDVSFNSDNNSDPNTNQFGVCSSSSLFRPANISLELMHSQSDMDDIDDGFRTIEGYHSPQLTAESTLLQCVDFIDNQSNTILSSSIDTETFDSRLLKTANYADTNSASNSASHSTHLSSEKYPRQNNYNIPSATIYDDSIPSQIRDKTLFHNNKFEFPPNQQQSENKSTALCTAISTSLEHNTMSVTPLDTPTNTHSFTTLEKYPRTDISHSITNFSLSPPVQTPPFGEEIIQYIAASMLIALDSLHTNSYIHRDIKPHNVLLASDGRCCISDFGLCVPFPSECDLFHLYSIALDHELTLQRTGRRSSVVRQPSDPILFSNTNPVSSTNETNSSSQHLDVSQGYDSFIASQKNVKTLLQVTYKHCKDEILKLPKYTYRNPNFDHTQYERRGGGAAGTIQYLAPERLLIGQTTIRSDVWSFGLSLLFIINGRLDLPNEYWELSKCLGENTIEFITQNYLLIDDSFSSFYSQDLRDFISACLTIIPIYRPASYQLLKHPFLAKMPYVRQYLRKKTIIMSKTLSSDFLLMQSILSHFNVYYYQQQLLEETNSCLDKDSFSLSRCNRLQQHSSDTPALKPSPDSGSLWKSVQGDNIDFPLVFESFYKQLQHKTQNPSFCHNTTESVNSSIFLPQSTPILMSTPQSQNVHSTFSFTPTQLPCESSTLSSLNQHNKVNLPPTSQLYSQPDAEEADSILSEITRLFEIYSSLYDDFLTEPRQVLQIASDFMIESSIPLSTYFKNIRSTSPILSHILDVQVLDLDSNNSFNNNRSNLSFPSQCTAKDSENNNSNENITTFHCTNSPPASTIPIIIDDRYKYYCSKMAKFALDNKLPFVPWSNPSRFTMPHESHSPFIVQDPVEVQCPCSGQYIFHVSSGNTTTLCSPHDPLLLQVTQTKTTINTTLNPFINSTQGQNPLQPSFIPKMSFELLLEIVHTFLNTTQFNPFCDHDLDLADNCNDKNPDLDSKSLFQSKYRQPPLDDNLSMKLHETVDNDSNNSKKFQIRRCGLGCTDDPLDLVNDNIPETETQAPNNLDNNKPLYLDISDQNMMILHFMILNGGEYPPLLKGYHYYFDCDCKTKECKFLLSPSSQSNPVMNNEVGYTVRDNKMVFSPIQLDPTPLHMNSGQFAPYSDHHHNIIDNMENQIQLPCIEEYSNDSYSNGQFVDQFSPTRSANNNNNNNNHQGYQQSRMTATSFTPFLLSPGQLSSDLNSQLTIHSSTDITNHMNCSNSSLMNQAFVNNTMGPDPTIVIDTNAFPNTPIVSTAQAFELFSPQCLAGFSAQNSSRNASTVGPTTTMTTRTIPTHSLRISEMNWNGIRNEDHNDINATPSNIDTTINERNQSDCRDNGDGDIINTFITPINSLYQPEHGNTSHMVINIDLSNVQSINSLCAVFSNSNNIDLFQEIKQIKQIELHPSLKVQSSDSNFIPTQRHPTIEFFFSSLNSNAITDSANEVGNRITPSQSQYQPRPSSSISSLSGFKQSVLHQNLKESSPHQHNTVTPTTSLVSPPFKDINPAPSLISTLLADIDITQSNDQLHDNSTFQNNKNNSNFQHHLNASHLSVSDGNSNQKIEFSSSMLLSPNDLSRCSSNLPINKGQEPLDTLPASNSSFTNNQSKNSNLLSFCSTSSINSVIDYDIPSKTTPYPSILRCLCPIHTVPVESTALSHRFSNNLVQPDLNVISSSFPQNVSLYRIPEHSKFYTFPTPSIELDAVSFKLLAVLYDPIRLIHLTTPKTRLTNFETSALFHICMQLGADWFHTKTLISQLLHCEIQKKATFTLSHD